MQVFILAKDFKLIEGEFVLMMKTKKVKKVTNYFQINEYFLTWKTIYQFQVKSQIIAITAIDSLKKEFYIQEFLKRFNVPNKKKKKTDQNLT